MAWTFPLTLGQDINVVNSGYGARNPTSGVAWEWVPVNDDGTGSMPGQDDFSAGFTIVNDNSQSFLQKYWLAIVIAVLIVLYVIVRYLAKK